MQVTQTQVSSEIIEILKDMTQEWEIDVDKIDSGTKLVEDLNFESIDLIHLVVSIEEQFKQKLGFDGLLMKDGKYVDDLSINQIANFVSQKLNGETK